MIDKKAADALKTVPLSNKTVGQHSYQTTGKSAGCVLRPLTEDEVLRNKPVAVLV